MIPLHTIFEVFLYMNMYFVGVAAPFMGWMLDATILLLKTQHALGDLLVAAAPPESHEQTFAIKHTPHPRKEMPRTTCSRA